MQEINADTYAKFPSSAMIQILYRIRMFLLVWETQKLYSIVAEYDFHVRNDTVLNKEMSETRAVSFW